MNMEWYKQLDFLGIVGYPNPISNDLRSVIPKFSREGDHTAKMHVTNIKSTIEELDKHNKDFFMKLFVQSMANDFVELYEGLPKNYITNL